MLAADVDAELGLESATWPDGPPQSGVARGVSVIRDQDRMESRGLRNTQE